MVNTVTGPIEASNIGKALIHEHFYVGLPGYLGDVTIGTLDQEHLLETGVQAARKILSYGVQTVVDPTPNDYGRDVRLLREISERTGVQIICATGYHSEEKGATAYFKKRMKAGQPVQDEIYELMMQEITCGIGQTEIRAGFIKVASSKNAITNYEECFFRAAARASRDTGVPILTHTENGTMGPEQADLLIAEGASPERILIGHMCGNVHLDYHLETLKRGVFIGFDRFGFPKTDDTARLDNLLQLIQSGYSERIMMSQDSVITTFGRKVVYSPEQQKLMENSYPTYVFEKIIPLMVSRGVQTHVFETILIRNIEQLFFGSHNQVDREHFQCSRLANDFV